MNVQLELSAMETLSSSVTLPVMEYSLIVLVCVPVQFHSVIEQVLMT